MTPQMIEAVPKTWVDGQMNPSDWSESHIPLMFVNIHACTPSCTVPAMTVAVTCAQNIGLGGIFI